MWPYFLTSNEANVGVTLVTHAYQLTDHRAPRAFAKTKSLVLPSLRSSLQSNSPTRTSCARRGAFAVEVRVEEHRQCQSELQRRRERGFWAVRGVEWEVNVERPVSRASECVQRRGRVALARACTRETSRIIWRANIWTAIGLMRCRKMVQTCQENGPISSPHGGNNFMSNQTDPIYARALVAFIPTTREKGA
jgi:hypothetical protein